MNKFSAEGTLSDSNTNVDMFDFMSLLRELFHTAFTSYVVQAGFRRAGLWPDAPECLIGVPRPANAGLDQIMSVDELAALSEKRCNEYKQRVLGSDAKAINCHYVDTTNGCVMMSKWWTWCAQGVQRTYQNGKTN